MAMEVDDGGGAAAAGAAVVGGAVLVSIFSSVALWTNLKIILVVSFPTTMLSVVLYYIGA